MTSRGQFGLLCVVILGIAAVMGTRLSQAEPVQKTEKNPRPSGRIAVVNMTKAFESFNLLERAREELKEQITSLEAEAKAKVADIKKLNEQLALHQKGTQAYDDVETARDRQQREFNEFRAGVQQRILQLDSELYIEVRRSVIEAVAKHAEAEGIDLVLQYNPDQNYETDPRKIIESLNRPVIYQRNLDVTDKVIAILNSDE